MEKKVIVAQNEDTWPHYSKEKVIVALPILMDQLLSFFPFPTGIRVLFFLFLFLTGIRATFHTNVAILVCVCEMEKGTKESNCGSEEDTWPHYSKKKKESPF